MGDVRTGTVAVKAGLAEMLKGGVNMDVTDVAQARIAEDAGAVAVMALERVPADIRRDGGVGRMGDPSMVEGITSVVTSKSASSRKVLAATLASSPRMKRAAISSPSVLARATAVRCSLG